MMKTSMVAGCTLACMGLGLVDAGCNAQADTAAPPTQDVVQAVGKATPSEANPGVTSAPKPISATFSVVEDMKIKGSLREDGAFVCRKDSCAPGIVAFGPYTRAVPPGPRVATFQLSGREVGLLDRDVATLDVYDALGKRKLGARTVKGTELADGTQKGLEIPFTAPEKSNLEFRIGWKGDGELRMYRVEVR